MKTFETVAADALELSIEERLALAEKMVMSVPADPEIEKAWEDEIQRRIRQFDNGEVKGIPGPEVFRAIRAKLRK
jgi:putative addiction module component (TIGR02574 family)